MWQASKYYRLALLVLILVTSGLIILVNNYDYFIGDVEIANAIQSTFTGDVTWAKILSNLAKFPYSMILLVVAVFIAFFIKGIRAVGLSIISFVALSLIDKLVKIFVFQVRPSADLISVLEKSSTSGFPSTSGIIYMATFGFLILLSAKFYKESSFNKIIFFVSFIPLIVIFIARIVLGAHWPSDIIITYMVGLVLIMLLLPFLKPVDR